MTLTSLLSATLLQALLPFGFAPVGSAEVLVDGRPAVLTRAQPAGQTQPQLGGEHVSSVEAGDRLLGYARMTVDMAKGPLPSKERAHEIALQFLQSHAPDLRAAHQLHWIAPHEETITLDGQRLVLTGMKVKMRSTEPDKLWFWVIVGPGEEVMVFERDIFWISLPGRRRTEKWLHDAWLADHGGAQIFQ